MHTIMRDTKHTVASPEMIFLDQGVGNLIKELAANAGREMGPVLLLAPEQKISSADVRLVKMPPNSNRNARSRLLV